MPAASSYWSASRAPRYSLLFAFPLLILYEALAFALSGSELGQVRNGADVLLKSVFLALGGRYGLTAFAVVLAATGGWLIWRDTRAAGGIRASLFPLMLAESVLYALLLGGVVSALTSAILTGRLAVMAPAPAGGVVGSLALPTQLMISLGAGIYEEILFRVLLVSGLAALARLGFGWRPLPAGVFAALTGALIFSAFHYIGPYGDPFQLGSFTFRAIAGLVFSAMYLLRGLGITAWCHALYDVFLALSR
jgi:hypothetical protein